MHYVIISVKGLGNWICPERRRLNPNYVSIIISPLSVLLVISR
jgi:hypothetical protein